MTLEEALELPAGIVLDRLIANKMGWDLPVAALTVSTDLYSAWMLLIELTKSGWHYTVGEGYEGTGKYFCDLARGEYWWYDPDKSIHGRGNTVPMAICQAALKLIYMEG